MQDMITPTISRAASSYVDDLVMSGAQAADQVQAARFFDMAEGAIAVLLLDDRISSARHQQLANTLQRTRRNRFPGDSANAPGIPL